MDNREFFDSNSLPNNSIFLTAPHTSDDVKYMPLKNYDAEIIYSQNGYDIGSFEVTNDLSEKLQ